MPNAADAHDAAWVGEPANTSQMQLMLMMLAGWPRQHMTNAADAHDAG